MIDITSADTLDLSGHDYIIFNYIDSLGCATCKMKLPIWKKFISLLDSVSEADVLTVMAIHPSARRDIPHIVRQQEFDYPVCIDVKNTIRDLNSLTTDVNLNTFLLDKRHRVIPLGNPTYSNKIAVMHIDLRLVLKYLKSGCTECDSGQKALAFVHLLLMEKEVSNGYSILTDIMEYINAYI